MSEFPVVGLFKGMNPARVASCRCTENMRGNTRVWTGADATEALALVQTLQGLTVPTDNVHENSWDWDRMKANPRYDPPWFSVAALERWVVEGEARDGGPVTHEIHTSAWFWALEEDDYISVREYHSSPNPREVLESHVNYFQIPRDEAQRVFDALMSKESTGSMKEQPFYKSKKFVYALATFLGALVVALLPTFIMWLPGEVVMEPQTLDMVGDLLPVVIGLGAFVLCGHQFNDALSLAKNIQGAPLKDAINDLVEALPIPEREIISDES